jgi:hypothetical protein
MNQTFAIEITELPTAGGLSEDPSVLHRVEGFLNQESHLRRLNQLLQADGCIAQYRSVIDCVLVELLPKFKDACLEFYEGKGNPLSKLHPSEKIEAADVELELALEVLVSGDWASWTDFKSNFKAEIKWEPLQRMSGIATTVRSEKKAAIHSRS